MGNDNGKIVLFAFFLALLWSVPAELSAQRIRIGLFDNQVIGTFVFHCTGGEYQISGDEASITKIVTGELVYISLIEGMLVLRNGDLHFGSFDKLDFTESGRNCSFRLKLVNPVREPLNYQGHLDVRLFHGSIQIINELHLNDYLAGVVEAEGGASAGTEFYKAQAILSRSYAVKNWERHPGQDMNLCDNTHCQAFHGISDENPIIYESVLATNGLVLADQNSSIVSAIYHSNSGGETQRASDIWNRGDEYLQAVVDPFSNEQRSATWEKSVSLEEWKNYLSTKSKYDIRKLTPEQLLIVQEHRKKFFIVGSDSIRIADIRNDLQLRSTFFTTEVRNDSLLFHGRGYGHGVGMSQEGAMEMDRQGYSYSDILRFYFYNVQIIEISDVPKSEIPAGFR